LASLAKTAQAQLKRAEALGKSLDERLKKKREASDEWTPDEDFRRDFAAVTVALQHGGNSLIRALESNKENLGGLTVAQLEAQYSFEIVKAATQLTDEQWDAMKTARAKAGRYV
jgi:hypothetical protein